MDLVELKPGEADPHGVLLNLAYGQKDVNYEIVGEGDNRTIEMINDSTYRTIGDLRHRGTDLINDITMDEIMEQDQDDPVMMYLLYGKKDVHYTIEDGEVKMNRQRIAVLGEKVYNEYGELLQARTDAQKGYVLDINALAYTDAADNAYLLVDSKETLTVADGEATLYYLYQDGKEVYYSKSTLGDLTGSDNIISRLTDRMTVGELFEDDMYIETDNGKTLRGTWKYLLKVGEEDETPIYNMDYKISEINSMLDNMTKNVKTATLYELDQDGIMDFEDSMLEKTVKKSIGSKEITLPDDIPENEYLGNLTTDQLLKYVNLVLS